DRQLVQVLVPVEMGNSDAGIAQHADLRGDFRLELRERELPGQRARGERPLAQQPPVLVHQSRTRGQWPAFAKIEMQAEARLTGELGRPPQSLRSPRHV